MGEARFSLLGRRHLASGRFLSVDTSYHIGPGGWTARDVVRHPGSVVIVPWDGRNIHFLRQFRAPLGTALLELPAGKLDVPGEPPGAAAERECMEELGLRPRRLALLHRCYTSPGFTDEVSWIYLAEDLEPVVAAPRGLEEAGAEMVSLSIDQAVRALAEGYLNDAKTLLGVYSLLRRLRR
jgi:8-oxo-dGTP pyrophosphatase MutT (NUDIX family)